MNKQLNIYFSFVSIGFINRTVLINRNVQRSFRFRGNEVTYERAEFHGKREAHPLARPVP